MKTRQTFIKIIEQAHQKGTFLPAGITNDNYRYDDGEDTLVIRIPKPHHDHGFDYHYEARVIEAVRPLNIDVETLFFDPTTGAKVARYIDHARGYQKGDGARAAMLMKTLHHGAIQTGKRFNIKSMFAHYHDQLQAPTFNLDPHTHFIDDAYQLSDTWILCHNDLVQGNFLFTPTRDYLIDYEYAMDNDPIFDVMSFITENDIVDVQERNAFYHSYFGFIPTGALKAKLDVFECAHHVLWCTWAMAMMETDANPIFQSIASLKYQRLVECVASMNP